MQLIISTEEYCVVELSLNEKQAQGGEYILVQKTEWDMYKNNVDMIAIEDVTNDLEEAKGWLTSSCCILKTEDKVFWEQHERDSTQNTIDKYVGRYYYE